MRLGVMVVQNAADDLTGWAIDHAQDTVRTFCQVTNWAEKLMVNVDKAVRAKAENIISIALIVLQSNRELDPGAALDAIAQAYGFRAAGRSDSRPAKDVRTLLRRARGSVLGNYAKIRLLSSLEVADALDRVGEVLGARDAERARSDSLQCDINNLKGQLAKEHEILETAKVTIADLERKIEVARFVCTGIGNG